jgi:hypothetical protein
MMRAYYALFRVFNVSYYYIILHTIYYFSLWNANLAGTGLSSFSPYCWGIYIGLLYFYAYRFYHFNYILR